MDRRDFIKTTNRRVTPWGQANITEKDPASYDIKWWRNHWRETETQGVIINAGKLRPLVSSQRIGFTSKNRWTEFSINSISDHEVIVIS